MKIETILNAMERARFKAAQIKGYKKHDLQYRAFRARIIKMDAEKDDFIEWAHEALEYYYDEDLAQRKQIAEKDARIAELEEQVKSLEHDLALWHESYYGEDE